MACLVDYGDNQLRNIHKTQWIYTHRSLLLPSTILVFLLSTHQPSKRLLSFFPLLVLLSLIPWQKISVTLELTCSCSVAQSCPTLCDPMDCSSSGSSVHRIFQMRILDWLAIFSRGSSQPRDRILVSWVSCTCMQILYHGATWATFRKRRSWHLVPSLHGK